MLSEEEARRAVEAKLAMIAAGATPTAQRPEHSAEIDGPAADLTGELTGASRLRRARALAIEKLRRDFEAVKLYEPNDVQERVHQSGAFIRIVRGGNQCLAAEQEIYDPVAEKFLQVGQIDRPFHVWCYDESTGQRVIGKAGQPFLKGTDDLYRVMLSNGQSFTSTLGHRVLTPDGWQEIGAIRRALAEFGPILLASSGEPCRSASVEGGRHSYRTPAGSTDHCSADCRPCDERPRARTERDQASTPQRAGARECNHSNSPVDVPGGTRGHTRSYRPSGLPSSLCAGGQTSVLAGASESRGVCTPCLPPSKTRPAAAQFQTPSGPPARTTAVSDRSASRSSYSDDSRRTLSADERTPSRTNNQASRRSSSLRAQNGKARQPVCDQSQATPSDAPVASGVVYVTSLEFVRRDYFYDFEVLPHHNYVIADVVHHNSGKTTSCLNEFVRAVTGRDPHGKYPKRDGIAIIVGYEEDHCSTVIYPRLFRADGSLLMIRDEKTRRWRAYREWQDAHRKSEARPAPPMIPPRLIRKVAWKNPAERVFSVVYLTNGWEIRYYSSGAEAPQGFAADLIWIDEDIKNADWIGEMLPRLAKRGGRLIWSALPKSRNLGLYTLSQKAWAEVGKENPDAVDFVLRFRDNKHIGQEERRKTIEGWAALGDEELRMRDFGEYVLDQYKVFPEFSMSEHGVDTTDLAKHPEYAKGSLPKDWCRYAVIDPGYQVCAVLFLAVPPPEFGDFVYLEDELYLRNCSDRMFGEAMAVKTSGKSYRAFVIDLHGSSRSESNGLTIRQQYSAALRNNQVRSEATGHGFIPGCDDKAARIMAVHAWLAPRCDGRGAKLRVPRGRLPNFLLEMEGYMKKRTEGGKVALDEPDDRKNNHLMHCLQYAAAYPGLRYVQPKPVRKAANPIVEYAKKKQKKRRQKEGRKYIHLGAGNAA